MKKLWLIILIISLVINAFCIFYVAVGAGAEKESGEYTFPEEIEAERAALTKYIEYSEKWQKESPLYLSTDNAPVSFTLFAPEYGGGWGIYEIEYTVKGAYTDDTLTEGMDTEKFAENQYYSEGKLSEGYTFLFVDVIIENKSEKKQMYLVNSIEAGEGLLGFSGQTFSNTAILHKELYPSETFETTLVFAIKEDGLSQSTLYVNNFGKGSPDGNCAYINITEVTK